MVRTWFEGSQMRALHSPRRWQPGARSSPRGADLRGTSAPLRARHHLERARILRSGLAMSPPAHSTRDRAPSSSTRDHRLLALSILAAGVMTRTEEAYVNMADMPIGVPNDRFVSITVGRVLEPHVGLGLRQTRTTGGAVQHPLTRARQNTYLR